MPTFNLRQQYRLYLAVSKKRGWEQLSFRLWLDLPF